MKKIKDGALVLSDEKWAIYYDTLLPKLSELNEGVACALTAWLCYLEQFLDIHYSALQKPPHGWLIEEILNLLNVQVLEGEEAEQEGKSSQSEKPSKLFDNAIGSELTRNCQHLVHKFVSQYEHFWQTMLRVNGRDYLLSQLEEGLKQSATKQQYQNTG